MPPRGPAEYALRLLPREPKDENSETFLLSEKG
jgi:hypothetical protein